MTKFNPPTCPSCGESLETVNWEQYETYEFNKNTGHYENNQVYGGEGYTKCPFCSSDLNEIFEEGPINF